MTNEQRMIRQLIFEELYPVDEDTVATAILARANVHAIVAGATFRSELRAPEPEAPGDDPQGRALHPELYRSLRPAA